MFMFCHSAKFKQAVSSLARFFSLLLWSYAPLRFGK